MVDRPAVMQAVMTNPDRTMGIVAEPQEIAHVGRYDVELLRQAFAIAGGLQRTGDIEIAASGGTLLIRGLGTSGTSWIAVAPRSVAGGR